MSVKDDYVNSYLKAFSLDSIVPDTALIIDFINVARSAAPNQDAFKGATSSEISDSYEIMCAFEEILKNEALRNFMSTTYPGISVDSALESVTNARLYTGMVSYDPQLVSESFEEILKRDDPIGMLSTVVNQMHVFSTDIVEELRKMNSPQINIELICNPELPDIYKKWFIENGDQICLNTFLSYGDIDTFVEVMDRINQLDDNELIYYVASVAAFCSNHLDDLEYNEQALTAAQNFYDQCMTLEVRDEHILNCIESLESSVGRDEREFDWDRG